MSTSLETLSELPLNLTTVTFEAATTLPALMSNNLLLYMTFSFGAYKPRPKTNPVEVSIGADFIGRIATTKASVDAFCIRETREAILAFRGSRSFAHWHGNLRADWVENVFGENLIAGAVHRGFHEAVEAIAPHARKLLEQCAKRCDGQLQRVTLCGHSRGGAIAELAGPAIAGPDRTPEIQIYSFGAPRVGEWRYARVFESLNLLHWRCEILGDPIPVVGFLGQHTGHLARIEPGNPNLMVLVKHEEAPLRRLMTTRFKPIDIIERHAAKNYLSVLRELAQGTSGPNETLLE